MRRLSSVLESEGKIDGNDVELNHLRVSSYQFSHEFKKTDVAALINEKMANRLNTSLNLEVAYE